MIKFTAVICLLALVLVNVFLVMGEGRLCGIAFGVLVLSGGWFVIQFANMGYPNREVLQLLGRIRDRLQPQFKNKLVVKFLMGPDPTPIHAAPDWHVLVEERVVGKRFGVFNKREKRLLVRIPFGFLNNIEIEDESIRTVVEDEVARFQAEPHWVTA